MVLAFRPAKFDCDISTLNISGFAETLSEGSYTAGERGGRFGPKISDHRHCWLLRARRDRPRRCCAAQGDYEFSPSDVDYHATPPAGGRMHAIEGTISRFSKGANNA